jgi:hypothetical protein
MGREPLLHSGVIPRDKIIQVPVAQDLHPLRQFTALFQFSLYGTALAALTSRLRLR